MIVTKAEHNPDLVVSVTAFSLCSKSHCGNLKMDYYKAVYFRRVQNFHLLLYLKKNRENVFLLNKYVSIGSTSTINSPGNY